MANHELKIAREFIETNQIKCNDLNLIALALAHPSYAQEKTRLILINVWNSWVMQF